MHDIRSANKWHFATHHKELGIDFCTWVLRIDGLRVPPFDTHADGRHFLQVVGMTADDWRTWFHTVLTRDREMRTLESIEEMATEGVALYNPITLWHGSALLKERLTDLWVQYELLMNRVSQAYALQKGTSDLPMTPKEWRTLWKTMSAFQTRLPPLDIYLVDYPDEVFYTLPPAIVVISNQEGTLRAQTYMHFVLRGAQKLANWTP